MLTCGFATTTGRQGRRRVHHGQAEPFVALDGAVKAVNRDLKAKVRILARIKGYVTNFVSRWVEAQTG